LPELRKRMKDSTEAAYFVRRAKRYLGGKLPDASKGEAVEKGSNAAEAKQFAKWASKGYAGQLREAISWLTPAYLLTGDVRYGREAVRRALHIAALDPEGVTSPKVSDFADGSCMRAMALAYDSCYDLLETEEKVRLREAMLVRARRFFDRQVNNLEARVFNAHVWQHILTEFAEVAFATLGEAPEAELWTSYVYELWIARFPLLGGDDGGWANGLNYFGTNLESMLVMPSLLGRLSGVDFYDQPWFRNVGYYQLYAWPPDSACDGFGDGSERNARPSLTRGYFTETLGRRFRDPHLLWYAEQVLGTNREAPNLPALMAWHRVRRPAVTELPAAKPPDELPQARAFYDVGVVSMHTQLGEAAGDLMIGFRASPYGAFNHMHACQNSFNILFGGRRLMGNSGYYIAYGDDHFNGWYKHTRGHNSVLIDGKGQAFGSRGWGYVARFLHGGRISYCLGDASTAYGDAGLTKFRRQLVLLRPSTVVIYDELEADHPAQWSWLLHSPAGIIADPTHRRLSAETDQARLRVDCFGSLPLRTAVDSRFDPPAVNWRKKQAGGRVIQYADQWHATLSPSEPSPKMRYLAVLEVRAADDTSPFPETVCPRQGRVTVGPWKIEAELDASRDAALLIEHTDGKTVLAADRPSATVGGREYRLSSALAILIEQPGNMVRRCSDRQSWQTLQP